MRYPIFYVIFSFIVFFIAIFCIIFPSDMLISTKSALSLWATVIVPSLLPFLIISELLQQTAITNIFAKLLAPIMNYVFKLPGISSIALFLGFTGGYPVGAKVTTDLRNKKLISQNDAKHLISFTNNAGPLFLSGAIGIGLYKSPMIGFLLMTAHYLSALLVGIIFSFFKKNNKQTTTPKLNFKIIKINELGSVLSNTINNSIISICIVGGFILLFSIISTIFEKLYITNFIASIIMPNTPIELSHGIISGILEVTTGANKIASVNISLLNKLIITSILVGFGGFSIHMQTLGIISSSDIKFSSYLLGKTLQSLISGGISFILLNYSFFSKILVLTTSTINTTINSYGFIQLTSTIICLFLFIIVFKIMQIIKHIYPS